MKRVNLQLDLNENEIFEREVENAIRAKVREIARDEHRQIIQEEAEAEVKRLTEGNTWGYRDKLKSIIREITADSIRMYVRTMDVEEIAKEKVDARIDYIVSETTRKVEQECKKALDSAISKAVQEKIGSILNA